MLEAKNLECARGHSRLFKDLNFSVQRGDLLQLTGPNGSGKTSLLRMLCGLLPPSNGEVHWHGTDIRKLGEEYHAAITYLGHRPGVKDDLTVIENLRLSAALTGFEITTSDALCALDQLALADRADLPARVLSEGQRRKVALARLALSRTPLWLLDEVLTSLDLDAVETVTDLIEGHLERGGMAVVATHQRLCLRAGALRHLEMAS